MAYGSITQRGDKYRVCFDYGVDRKRQACPQVPDVRHKTRRDPCVQ